MSMDKDKQVITLYKKGRGYDGKGEYTLSNDEESHGSIVEEEFELPAGVYIYDLATEQVVDAGNMSEAEEPVFMFANSEDETLGAKCLPLSTLKTIHGTPYLNASDNSGITYEFVPHEPKKRDAYYASRNEGTLGEIDWSDFNKEIYDGLMGNEDNEYEGYDVGEVIWHDAEGDDMSHGSPLNLVFEKDDEAKGKIHITLCRNDGEGWAGNRVAELGTISPRSIDEFCVEVENMLGRYEKTLDKEAAECWYCVDDPKYLVPEKMSADFFEDNEKCFDSFIMTDKNKTIVLDTRKPDNIGRQLADAYPESKVYGHELGYSKKVRPEEIGPAQAKRNLAAAMQVFRDTAAISSFSNKDINKQIMALLEEQSARTRSKGAIR